jgi:hypothetical protein
MSNRIKVSFNPAKARLHGTAAMAYAAGLFDGEACVHIARQKKVQSKRGYVLRLVVTIAQNHLETLLQFQAMAGVEGRIYMRPRQGSSNRDGYVERPARVSSTCLVSMARNRYSVPCEWAGHMVSSRLYPNRVDVVAGDTLVASHARVFGRGQTIYNWQHYIDLVQRKPGALRNGTPFLDLPAPLQRLRQGLLRHEGGERVMAQVLAVVPQAGLEAVLVAVELVLESGTPSGGVSVEHVRNVLARLNTPEQPPQAETALLLREAPKADTARYDRLRPTQQDDQEINHA